MSTKNTLAHGRTFHLYGDCFDREAVWIELYGADFDANRRSVTLRIPMEIWELIRQKTSVVFDLADKTDEEIEHQARAEVEARIDRFRGAKGAQRKLLAASGLGEPRADQVRQLKRALTLERMGQQRLQRRIGRLQAQAASRPVGEAGPMLPPIAALGDVHPGEFLREHLMRPAGLTAADLARMLPPHPDDPRRNWKDAIDDLLKADEDSVLDIDLALAVERIFGLAPGDFYSIEGRNTVRDFSRKLAPWLAKIRPMRPVGPPLRRNARRRRHTAPVRRHPRPKRAA